ncbi:hypothetical protein [uncultured Methylobacterium sp.]|jgi:muramidase (phage lysozyme)|uniref:hypothetical protein n=1 Tax=uncultured Methylobacterium sp. TaxID=157278 RepID=UPI00263131EE|nr:hypothetical protein [uncultured Methylobacterium sp.]
MDKTVPAGAAVLLDFIASKEAPRGYGTVYGDNQDKLPKPLTGMTLDEVIAAGPGWTKRFGSSAAGRYQFMRATLQGLKTELRLTGRELLDPDLQDRLGFHLLKRRGYVEFMGGSLSVAGFGLRIAQEWASFPVLASTKGSNRQVSRGQSYYAGDGLNKALVSADAVEVVLLKARAAGGGPVSAVPPVAKAPAPADGPVRAGVQATGGAVRSGLAGLYDAIRNALARKA